MHWKLSIAALLFWRSILSDFGERELVVLRVMIWEVVGDLSGQCGLPMLLTLRPIIYLPHSTVRYSRFKILLTRSVYFLIYLQCSWLLSLQNYQTDHAIGHFCVEWGTWEINGWCFCLLDFGIYPAWYSEYFNLPSSVNLKVVFMTFKFSYWCRTQFWRVEGPRLINCYDQVLVCRYTTSEYESWRLRFEHGSGNRS